MVAGQHTAIGDPRPGASVPSDPVLPGPRREPALLLTRDDDQAGQGLVLCALTLTRQIWLLCARRDAKARARKTANTRRSERFSYSQANRVSHAP